jgi:hypothetical protein
MISGFSPRQWATANWFFLVLPLLLAISFAVARQPGHELGSSAEAVLLFDWCVTVPALYALCYRKALPLPRLLLRLVALACLGVWFVSWMVPVEAQEIVPHLSWARTAGLLVLALVELRLLLAALKIAFSDQGSAADIQKASGAPPLLAKLMLIEARFWRAVWKIIRGR